MLHEDLKRFIRENEYKLEDEFCECAFIDNDCEYAFIDDDCEYAFVDDSDDDGGAPHWRRRELSDGWVDREAV